MQKIRWFLLIIAILLALTLTLQNNEGVPVRLLWMDREMPLSIMLASTTAVGFLVGALTTALMLRRGKSQSPSKGSATAESATVAEPVSEDI